MRAFLYNDGKATELPFAEGAAQFGTAELVWLHLDGQEPQAAEWLDAQTDLLDIVRSALTALETRPRSDVIGRGAILNLRGMGATPDNDPDALVSLRFWAETGRVISFTFRTPLALYGVIDKFLGAEIADPGDLLSSFADTVTHQLNPEVATLGDSLDKCEVALETSGLFTMRRKVSKVRAQSSAYRRFVAPQRAALEELSTAALSWLDSDDRLHLRESADRAARMTEELEAIRERAALMHEQLTDLRSEQIDGRSLLISIVALIFLPLTFITGLLGMNVEGIPYAKEPWAFWGVAAFCIAIGVGVLAYFIGKRWISR